MTSEQFCFWLQGFLTAAKTVDADQLAVIRDRLDAVMAPAATVTITTPAPMPGSGTAVITPGIWGVGGRQY
jgi:hypothetical protein